MLNLFIGVGRLTKDPELRKSNNDVSIAVLSIAFDNAITNEDGERGTTFLDARAFKEKAESIVKNLHKGSKVAVQGVLNQRDFLRQDGSKGKTYEIILDKCEFLDPKPQDDAVFEEAPKPVEESEVLVPKYDPMTGKPLKPSKK